jgi:hypothetical protein
MNKNEVVKFFKSSHLCFHPLQRQWMKMQMLKNCSACGVYFCCSSNFIITDEHLEWIPMHETPTVETIFCETDKLLQQYALPFKKPVCIVTDGFLPVMGTDNEWNHGGKINTFHCVMQQAVLCGKIIRLEDIWKTAVSVVNFVYAWWFYHGHFASFLLNIENEYEDLPYYNEIHWLSYHRT